MDERLKTVERVDLDTQPEQVALLRAKAQAGEGPDAVLVTKTYPIQVKALPEESGQDGVVAEIVIGTSDRDRSQDVIDTAGYQLDNYLRNPVVLWAHQYHEPPVGACSALAIEAAHLVAKDRFVPQDLYPFGHMIGQMVVKGWLRAASVGILIKEWTFDQIAGGIHSKSHELLEHSICPVPDNPYALRRAIEGACADGVNLDPMRSWVEKALDAFGKEPGMWVPKSRLETAFALLGAPRGIKFIDLKPEEMVKELPVSAVSVTASAEAAPSAEAPAETPAEEPRTVEPQVVAEIDDVEEWPDLSALEDSDQDDPDELPVDLLAEALGEVVEQKLTAALKAALGRVD